MTEAEQSEALKQELLDFKKYVSDAVRVYFHCCKEGDNDEAYDDAKAKLRSLIIPVSKPDTLVEVIEQWFDKNGGSNEEEAQWFRDALEAHGWELREKGK